MPVTLLTKVARPRGDRLLVLASVSWVGLLLALPTLQTSGVTVWATGVLLTVNFLVSIWALIHQKRILVLLNLAQIALFTVLPYQVFRAFGPDHYQFNRPPGLWDWLQFTGAHILRAVDLLDFLEEYQIDLQNVKHRSTPAGLLLVALHIAVDIFLIGLATRLVGQLWQRLLQGESNTNAAAAATKVMRRKAFGEKLGRFLKTLQAVCLGACGFAIWLSAIAQSWRGSNLVLWPLDNLLRTVDFFDAMQIFHWRLHNVEMGFWMATLAVSFRFFAGLYLARWLNYLHLKVLGHRALRTIDDLIGNLRDDNAAFHEAAAVALGQIGPGAQAAVPALIGSLEEGETDVRLAAAEALGQIGPGAQAAVPTLVSCLEERETDVWLAAAEALAQIDPHWPQSSAAQAAVLALVERLGYGDADVRQASADALGRIGPGAKVAVPALAERLADGEADVRRAASAALGRIDPHWTQSADAQKAVPALMKLVRDRSASVQIKKLAEKVLKRIKCDPVQFKKRRGKF